jgi:hypothetical protein
MPRLRACEIVIPEINAVIETWQPEKVDVAAARKRQSPVAGVSFLQRCGRDHGEQEARIR